MTLSIDDVANWKPDELTTAGNAAGTLQQNLDTKVAATVTDTGNLSWSGQAGAAAGTRMETEKGRASKVSDALLALKTAFTTEVQRLKDAKDKVLRLRDDAINQQPPFDVAADGTVTAGQRTSKLRAAGDDKGNVETAVLNEDLEAARRQWELTLALRDAETAANDAKTRVTQAVAQLQQAYDGLGDPNLGVTQAPNISTSPAAATAPSTSSTTSKPSYVSSGSHGSSGSGSHSNTSYVGSPASTSAPTTMPTGDQKKWIEEAIQALREKGYNISDSDAAIIATIIEKESGGNPNAINLWDSNAAAGIPSKGLMQTIDPTFNSYKLPGHDDIWNPVDNIIAGSRYAIERYGSLSNVPGIAAMSQGSGYVGY